MTGPPGPIEHPGGVDPLDHGTASAGQLRARRRTDDDERPVGASRTHRQGGLGTRTGHDQDPTPQRADAHGVRPVKGIGGRPVDGMRQARHPRPRVVRRDDRDREPVRGMGHAQLTDQPGQQAVDDLRRTHDAETADLVEVDHERRPTHERVAARGPLDPGDAGGQLPAAQPDARRRAAPQLGPTMLGRREHPGGVGVCPVEALALAAAVRQPGRRGPSRSRAREQPARVGAGAASPPGHSAQRRAVRSGRGPRRAAAEARGRRPRRGPRAPEPRQQPTGRRVPARSGGAAGQAISTSPVSAGGAATGVMWTVPSPGQRTGGPGPEARRSRSVVEPTTTVERTSMAVTPSMRAPSTATPLVDPQSSTVTPCDPTAKVA